MENEVDLDLKIQVEEFIIEPQSVQASPTRPSHAHHDHCENRDPIDLCTKEDSVAMDPCLNESVGIQCAEQHLDRSRVTLGSLDFECNGNPQNVAPNTTALVGGKVIKVRKKKPKRGRPPKNKEKESESQDLPKKWKREMIIRIYNEDGFDQFGKKKRGPKPKFRRVIEIDPTVERVYDEDGIDQFGIRKPGRPRKRKQNGEPAELESASEAKKRKEDKRMVKQPERYQVPNKADSDPVRIFDEYGVDQFGKMKRGRRPQGVTWKSRKPEKPPDWVPRIYNEEGVDQFGQVKRGRPPKGIKWKPRVKLSKPAKTVPNTSEPAVDHSEPAVGHSEPVVGHSEPVLNSSEPAVDHSEPALNALEPAKCSRRAKPSKSVKLTKSAKPSKSPKPSKSVKLLKSANTSEPAVDHSEPAVGHSEPVLNSSEPAVDHSEPALNALEPAKCSRRAKPSKSVKLPKSANPSKPAKPSKPVKPSKPAKPGKFRKPPEEVRLVYNEEGIDQFGRKKSGRKKGKRLSKRLVGDYFARNKRREQLRLKQAQCAEATTMEMTQEELELERRKNIPPIFRTYNEEGVDEFGRKKSGGVKSKPKTVVRRRKKMEIDELKRPTYAAPIRVYNRKGVDQFGQRKRGRRAYFPNPNRKKVKAQIVPPVEEEQPAVPSKDRPKRELKIPTRLEIEMAVKPATEPIKKVKLKKKKTPKKPQLKQTISAMVVDALTNLRCRAGSSPFAIKKYMRDVFKCDTTKLNSRINQFILRAEGLGVLFRTSGNGARGLFKIAKKNTVDFPQGRLKVLKKKKKKKKPIRTKDTSDSLAESMVDLCGHEENLNLGPVARATIIEGSLEDSSCVVDEEQFTANSARGAALATGDDQAVEMFRASEKRTRRPPNLLPTSTVNIADLLECLGKSFLNDEEEVPNLLMNITTSHTSRRNLKEGLASDPLAEDPKDMDSSEKCENEGSSEWESTANAAATDVEISSIQSAGGTSDYLNKFKKDTYDEEESSGSDEFE